ncbi:UNKNOWN [Stylonychia lemnae]|uniref:Uncharacterized protein n=1 Tax=Stylonychia lemnae TaxID=5949 RepID=A0A077ZXS3_STYLE|nr:UNKNOWN [Stylonychia lemnae]|eukprot:CDW74377.1 UNKNOWN [Stylonychia lemnae]
MSQLECRKVQLPPTNQAKIQIIFQSKVFYFWRQILALSLRKLFNQVLAAFFFLIHLSKLNGLLD